MTHRKAVIIKISSGDAVYIKDESSNVVGFSFGKIFNYHGESAKELNARGLQVGKQVDVEYDNTDRVRLVTLI